MSMKSKSVPAFLTTITASAIGVVAFGHSVALADTIVEYTYTQDPSVNIDGITSSGVLYLDTTLSEITGANGPMTGPSSYFTLTPPIFGPLQPITIDLDDLPFEIDPDHETIDVENAEGTSPSDGGTVYLFFNYGSAYSTPWDYSQPSIPTDLIGYGVWHIESTYTTSNPTDPGTPGVPDTASTAGLLLLSLAPLGLALSRRRLMPA
jgi:hypothetical protein